MALCSSSNKHSSCFSSSSSSSCFTNHNSWLSSSSSSNNNNCNSSLSSSSSSTQLPHRPGVNLPGHLPEGQASSTSGQQQPATSQQQQARAVGPTAAAAAAASSTEFDIAVRNKFSSRPQAALQPPSQPPSAAAAAWCGGLGIGSAVLQQWGAGMAAVPHPETKQLVEVLALPYYRRGALVDLRCLQLSGGRLLGSWLAVGSRELFMQREPQDAATVVFVGCELDVLLLSAAGHQAIALTQQTPIWLDPGTALQQQQQPAPELPPLQQVLQLRQRQQVAHLQQQQQQQQQQQHRHVPEDPRLRLSGLAAELDKLKRQYEAGAAKKQVSSSSSSSGGSVFELEGLLVSDISQQAPSGLSLLLPAASSAVIAMPQGHEKSCGSLVGSHLAGLLGEVHCRHMQWPDAYPADVAADIAAAAAAAAAVDGSVSPQQLDQRQQQQLYQQQQQHFTALQEALLADPAAPPGQGSSWDVVLLHALQGPQGVAAAVDGAYVWPIMGLERFSDHAFDLLTYYQTPSMDQIAVSTGWPSLDDYYKVRAKVVAAAAAAVPAAAAVTVVAPGEVTLVTGVPNSGKSEWLDALAVNLALQHGWRFAVCSMEKRPRDHARQLLEKIARRPLLSAGYAGEVPRMSAQELDLAYRELCGHFFVIAGGEDSMPSMAWVLEKAKAAKIQFGISGLIIDPYNELDPTRAANMKEHEHVNEVMGLLRRFSRENGVHCWLVAHPRQMGNMWRGERPGLQDVSGGANFMNKTDNGIIVHRNWSKLKELQERAAGDEAAAGGSKRRPAAERNGSGAEAAAAAAAAAEGGLAGIGDEQQQQALHNAEFEVQVIVEKVRNKTTGSRGACVLVYDRATGRYHEQGEDPDRRGLLDDAPVWTDSPGSLEVTDWHADGVGQQAQEVHSSYDPVLHVKEESWRLAGPDAAAVQVQPLLSQLLRAAADGNVGKVRQLVQQQGLDVNQACVPHSRTALHAAAERGQHSCCSTLLELGADSYQHDARQVSALMLAAQHGHEKVLKVLLNAGADAYAVDEGGVNALLLAARCGSAACVQLLLAEGVDADYHNSALGLGEHALLAAAEGGWVGCVQLLLAAGARVNRTDKEGRTALWSASRGGHPEVVRLLLRQPRIKHIQHFISGTSPLQEAQAAGHAGLASLLAAHLATASPAAAATAAAAAAAAARSS
ncbi:hypothetical protein COO60DRAFT_1699247 [Scenedesmus sp. NREL 46B-D3]|nr:hypothetical protein COO60DRAFT_1699247 [Scenedesmus sp. NREL 46B-D3]